MDWLDEAQNRVAAQQAAAYALRQKVEQASKPPDGLVKRRLLQLSQVAWPQAGVWNRPTGHNYGNHYAWTVEEPRSSVGLPAYHFFVVTLWLTEHDTPEFRVPLSPDATPEPADTAPTTGEGLLELLKRYKERGPHFSSRL